MIDFLIALLLSSRILVVQLLLIDKESAAYLLVDYETARIFDFLQMGGGLVELTLGRCGVNVPSQTLELLHPFRGTLLQVHDCRCIAVLSQLLLSRVDCSDAWRCIGNAFGGAADDTIRIEYRAMRLVEVLPTTYASGVIVEARFAPVADACTRGASRAWFLGRGRVVTRALDGSGCVWQFE